MQVTFVPEICKGKGAEYEGSITMRQPTYDERLGIYEEAGFGQSAETEEEEKELKKEVKKKGIQLMRLAARKVPEYLGEIKITRKSDGFVFDSWDKLQYDSDMGEVIQQCATRLISKFKVGSPS